MVPSARAAPNAPAAAFCFQSSSSAPTTEKYGPRIVLNDSPSGNNIEFKDFITGGVISRCRNPPVGIRCTSTGLSPSNSSIANMRFLPSWLRTAAGLLKSPLSHSCGIFIFKNGAPILPPVDR